MTNRRDIPSDGIRGRPHSMAEARGILDRNTADAHRRWVLRGKTGEGFLDIVGFDASESRLDGEAIKGARLSSVSFRRANVSYTDISEGVLVSCDFTGAQISSLKLWGAEVEGCQFAFARATFIDFKNAIVRKSMFDGSDLDKSRWVDAMVEGSSFRQSSFGNSQFDSGRFRHCDFRQSRFRPTSMLPPISMRGAVFETCDFRDVDFTGADLSFVIFRDCKLGNIRGKRIATLGLEVIDCDYSGAGDGSLRGGVEELRRRLQ